MRLPTILLEIDQDQDGSSMVEFVMFLPMFVTVFAGLMNLNTMNMKNTTVLASAQQKMWDEAIPVSSSGVTTLRVSAPGGGGQAASEFVSLVGNANNSQKLADTAEGLVMSGGTALYGHWGESKERLRLLDAAGLTDVSASDSAEDTIGSGRVYPLAVMDDGPDFAMPSGILGVVAALITGTGSIHGLGAGIRYGEAFGDASKSITVGSIGSYTKEAHYDVLVAPSPVKGNANKAAIGLAFLMAQKEDYYKDLQIFGDKDHLPSGNGGSSSGGASLGIDASSELGDANTESGNESDHKQDSKAAKEAEDARKAAAAAAAAAAGP